MSRLCLIPVLLLGGLFSQTAAAQTGFYFGGTVGNTAIDTDFDDFNLDYDESDFGWSAHAGIQATDFFAIEASYNDFGAFSETREFDLTQTDVRADLTGYDVMAVLSIPLGPLSLYGKGGVVFWDAKATAQILPPVGPGSIVSAEDTGNDLAFGGGLEFQFTPTLALRGEIEYFDIEDTEEVWFASVGLTYRF